jgi:hypothetical protein
MALNVDGSVFASLGSVGFEASISDHQGSFLYCFYGDSGRFCIIHAQILALLHSL